MASTDIIDLLLPWTQDGQEAERKMTKFLRDGIDHIRERKSDLFGRIKKSGSISNLVTTWMEAASYQLRITGTLATSTITFSGYLMNEAISDDTMKQHIMVGTILRRSDGLQVKVATVDYANLQCTVAAHGNSGTLSDDAAAVVYTIIGDVTSDYATDYQPRAVDRGFRECSIHIWKEFYETPWTKMNILKMESVADEMAYQIKELQTNLYNKIGMSVLDDRPPYSGGVYLNGLKTATPSMTGVCTWPDILYSEMPNDNVYVDAGGVELDPDTLNSLITGLYYDEKADFNTGEWLIATGPVQGSYISDMGLDDRRFGMTDDKYGYRVSTFRSKMGKDFEIMIDDKIREDTLLLLDVSAFEYGYAQKEDIRVINVAQGLDRVTKKMITGVTWGTRVRSPRQKIAKIYGLPTSYA